MGEPGKTQIVTAGTLKSLLAQRHWKDVFVPECKDGPTWIGSHLRLDAWAMKRSWAQPCTYGYEIKVSRSDFLRDDKWPEYLMYCNQFYLACPPGLIAVEELPADVGLLYASRTGTRLYMKRKAPHRQVEIPEDFYRYILMHRTTIIPAGPAAPESPRAFWQRWFEGEATDREFGWMVSRKIQQTVEERIDKVEVRNRQLVDQMKEYEGIRAMLRQAGCPAEGGDYWWRDKARKAAQSILTRVPADLLADVRRSIGALEGLERALKEMTKRAGVNDG
ncbi:MAG TPA: MmcB family DNA repair protein [bacterium]|nr:MmcB family DNA repair protein [bacterium]